MIETGTVSEGTHRVQDLLPRFMDVLYENDSDSYQRITSTIWSELRVTYSELCGDEDNPVWKSESFQWIFEVDLWEAMEELAPEGYYFGAHPRDGADFGYWEVEDEWD